MHEHYAAHGCGDCVICLPVGYLRFAGMCCSSIAGVMYAVGAFTRMAGQDPTVKEGLEILKGCLQGNVPNPETLQALLQKCQ